MRRTTRRLSAFLAAAGFLSAATETFALEPCPHHGVPPAVEITEHADHHASPGHEADHEESHDPCNCLGTCCPGGTSAVPVAPSVPFRATSPSPQPEPAAAVRMPIARAIEYLFPLPNAPPASLS